MLIIIFSVVFTGIVEMSSKSYKDTIYAPKMHLFSVKKLLYLQFKVLIYRYKYDIKGTRAVY